MFSYFFSRRNPLLLNGSADMKGRNGNSNSSANAFIDCTLESLATEDLKNEVRPIQGGPSGRGQAFVDIEIRVALLYKNFILWRNF